MYETENAQKKLDKKNNRTIRRLTAKLLKTRNTIKRAAL